MRGKPKKLKVLLFAMLFVVAFGVGAPYAYNLQHLLRYRFAVYSQNGPIWMTAYAVVGAFYESATVTYSTITTVLENIDYSKSSQLREIRLRIDDGSLEAMVSDVPESAKAKYYRAWLQYPDGRWKKVKYRLRGRSRWHFGFEKPSIRIKTRRENPYEQLRHINLINPEDRTMLANMMADNLAQDVGVMTYPSEMVRVFLNGHYKGVYQFQARDDEEMLRKIGRLPGPIFFGNYLKENWNRKDFELSGEGKWLSIVHDDPMTALIQAIESDMTTERYRELWLRLDKKMYAKWHAVSVLAGSLHTDYHHNQQFFFDPSRGILEPFNNDSNGHGMFNYPSTWRRLVRPFIPDFEMPINEMISPLLDVALRDPRFLHLRNQALFDLISGSGSAGEQIKRLRAFAAKMKKDIYADRHKGALQDTFLGLMRLPYNNAQYDDALKKMEGWIKGREQYILDELDKVSVNVTFIGQADSGENQFVVSVNGNVSASFQAEDISSLSADSGDHGTTTIDVSRSMTLYPGLREDTDFKYDHYFYVKRFPKYYLFGGEQSYVFRSGLARQELKKALFGAFKNEITGASIEPIFENEKNNELTTVSYNKISIHPWRFDAPPTGNVVLGPGNVNLKDDLIVPETQSLIVKPGTNLFLGGGVSIVSKGLTKIEGTTEHPITISPLVDEEPWGVLSIIGQGSNGSSIHHTDIRGGSMKQIQNLPYLGMVNIHWSNDFSMANSTLASNFVSDDTLHIINSKFSLKNVRFDNCLGDCIDFDYANGVAEKIFITDAGNDGIDFMTSNVALDGVQIERAGDKGLSIGEGSNVNVHNLKVRQAATGISIKDASVAYIETVTLTKNDVAVDVYKKNWRYGIPGTAHIKNTNFIDNKLDINIQKKGTVYFIDQPVPVRIEGDGEAISK